MIEAQEVRTVKEVIRSEVSPVAMFTHCTFECNEIMTSKLFCVYSCGLVWFGAIASVCPCLDAAPPVVQGSGHLHSTALLLIKLELLVFRHIFPPHLGVILFPVL